MYVQACGYTVPIYVSELVVYPCIRNTLNPVFWTLLKQEGKVNEKINADFK